MVRPLPLLGVKDLKKWVGRPIESIALPVGYNSKYWRSSGAAALAEVCEQAVLQKDRKIGLLLPGYFCGPSLRYLRNIRVNLKFYPLTDDLTPDYSFIKESLVKNKIDIFLLVHYFGRISSQLESRILADENDLILIEDCAHVISPSVSNKWVGDYLIFSPHKHFPLPLISLILAKRNYLNDLNSMSILPIQWFLKQLIKNIYQAIPKAEWKVVWSGIEEKFVSKVPHSLTVGAASNYLSKTDWYAKTRKNNAILLLNSLALTNRWKPLFDLKEIESPYLLAMLCDTADTAKYRYNVLNKDYRIVMQWPYVPMEIQILKKMKTQNINSVERILFFVVHQDIDIDPWLESIKNKITMSGF